MKKTFIGDVHGCFGRYKTILKHHKDTIQLGDMGVGFYKYTINQDIRADMNPPHYKMKEGNHRFIRGNHDNPNVCKKHSQYLFDGYTEEGMMFVGSAASIDISERTKHMDWWEDEELVQDELDIILNIYEQYKPKVMVTHDCPEFVAERMARYDDKKNGSKRIRENFNHMFSLFQPDVWIFGHWHQSIEYKKEKTRFICLNELEVREIEF